MQAPLHTPKKRTEQNLQMSQPDDIQQRRNRAAKTAWALAIIAVVIFTAFILSGVLNS